MKKVIPAIGIAAVLIQIIRFWPLDFTSLLSAFVTGGIMYLACKLGWDNQKDRIRVSGYQGWREWFKRTSIGLSIFFAFSMILLFFSATNPICEEYGNALYGRCEQYVENAEEGESKTIPFNPASKALYPLFLAVSYYSGSAAMLRQYHLIKQQVMHVR